MKMETQSNSTHHKTELEQFQAWLNYMETALEDFLERFPADVKEKLDYSPESLLTLEEWLISHFSDSDDLLKTENSLILDGFARYIGTTFQKAVQGNWTISFNDPNEIYHGLPVVDNMQGVPGIICPITLATSSVSKLRRTGKHMYKILQRSIETKDLPKI